MTAITKIAPAPVALDTLRARIAPLADEILFGKLVRGGHVRILLKDGKIGFEIEAGGTPSAPSLDEAAELAE